MAAIHLLGQVESPEIDDLLSNLLCSSSPFLREHAVWVQRTRVPRPDSIRHLVRLVKEGDFTGMLAQRALENWAKVSSQAVLEALETALADTKIAGERYRLVEMLGVVQDKVARAALIRIILNTDETEHVRLAAVMALGDQPFSDGIVQVLEGLIEENGPLADAAQLALMDLRSTQVSALKFQAKTEGLTIVQFFLHANIDSELRHAGSGDTGGIATLLVSLGDALVAQEHQTSAEPLAASASVLPRHRVLTISRGQLHEPLDDAKALRHDFSGHKYARIPLIRGAVPSAQSWPLHLEVRRGLRRILKAAGRIDAMHLRMADVGSFAAFEVAQELQIPVVFTVAPDPHAVIESMDRSSELTRENFGRIDQIQHFWFRTWLVEHLASHAAHTVYFPRPNLNREMKTLLGRDLSAELESYTVVPEGIDVNIIHRATLEAEEFACGSSGSEPLRELRQLLERLPEKRRGLPLLISVGRFHRIKGMATLVEAWAGSDLCSRTNLLLVGGNLDTPSPDESEQLDRINALVAPAHQDSSGLILSGHRPNGTVARWIAAAKVGIPHYAAASGVYVCASVKEEFGIALLEAMAAGLIVVAPNSGGPASYIDHGYTGFLTNTQDPEQLKASITEALRCAFEERTNQRADDARQVVEANFTIGTMADELSRVYAKVKQDHEETKRELDSIL